MRFLLLSLLMLSVSLLPAQQKPLNLMPMPASVQVGSGHLVIAPDFTIGLSGGRDPRLQRATESFVHTLRAQLGFTALDIKIVDAAQATFLIHAERESKEVQELGEDESYSLDVTQAGVKLNAPTTRGVMRGLQTFLQLVQTAPEGFAVPVVTIRDQPRFPWRGLMIDVSRHFMPLDVLKRNLDGMAAVKLNVFHWHLSDDQGFRVESKKFPKLQEMGSDGLYYTQEEVREVIAYARERGIRVVPEFDMPGHTTSWFVGYPELASGPGPFQIERKWGIFDPIMDPTEESTYKFLDKFIGEMAELFPDKYFHIGGDEVNGKQWEANPKIQAFEQAHGIKTKQQLQAYFTQRVQKLVSKHGKTMLGWDEILQPGIPNDIVVQTWREETPSPTIAAKQGFLALAAYGYYLDLNWPAARHYLYDPIGNVSLTPEQEKLVLGGEACMWVEYVSPESIDSRIWPRMAAIAERFWSPANVRDVDSMYQRMEATSDWLEWIGLTHNSNYRPMLQRIAGSDEISALRILADVVEPVQDYLREEYAPVPATSLTPIDRVIDAARPESKTARNFNRMVDAIVAGQADADMRAQVKGLLICWRDNDAQLQQLGARSSLVKEVMALSASLSRAANAGLQALDFLERGERAPDAWMSQQSAILSEAEQQNGQLLLMVVPGIQKLVESARK